MSTTQQFYGYEEQRELVKASLAGNEQATLELIQCSYHLILKIAHPYAKQQLDLEDLVQEGIIGLLEAIPKYRPESSTKFTTYAFFWIRKRISSFASKRYITIPELKLKKLNDYQSFLQECESRSETPSEDEILKALSISKEELDLLKNIPSTYLLFDSLLSIESYSQEKSEDLSDCVVLKVLIEDALTCLSELERFIIIRRFCLFDTKRQQTYAELADHLGYTQKGIRSMEKRALAKLREYLESIQK